MNRNRLSAVKSPLLIFCGFLLTSTGHLAWMYHLMEQTSAFLSFQLSTVAGYALQAVGVGLFLLFLRNKRLRPRVTAITALMAYAAFSVPAVMETSLLGTIVFGFLLSLLCGVIAGYYLYVLTRCHTSRRALFFGAGYSAATIGSWLLSLIDGGKFYNGNGVILICLVLSALTIAVACIPSPQPKKTTQPALPQNVKAKTFLLVAGGVVLLFSLVNNIGFSYAASEVQGGLRPELSRLFYAVGLIAAGIVTDKSRKYGAVCALAALILPFIVLALKGEPLSSVVFWALGYLAFGFYAVFRVIIFSDIAQSHDALFLSGFGLLIGRCGDALGSEIYAIAEKQQIILTAVSAILFIGAVFLFIKLFQLLYAPSSPKSENDTFNRFAVQFELSGREQEVLRLLLDNKSNKEISALMCVSENTVKFHVRNLLRKTSCKNRAEIKTAYHAADCLS